MKVESVARRAGIDKRTLYDYIQRKEDLLLLVFSHFLPRILYEVREARDEGTEPADQLAAMLRTHTRIVSENPYFVLFLYRELPYLHKDDQGAVHAMINDIHLEYSRIFGVLSRNRADLLSDDAELNASSALAMIDMIGLYRPHVKGRDPEVIADYILRALLRGSESN
jgi:AcrR family transcriptional regulator